MSFLDFLIDFLNKHHIETTILIIVAVFILFLKYIDSFYKLKSSIYEFFSKFFSRAGKVALSSKLRGSVIGATKDFGMSNNDIIPKDLKIKWIENGKAESFISGNQVVIRIKKTNNPNENLLSAVSSYVNTGLLYNYKRYIDEKVIKASNLTMIRKIVQYSGKSSVTYFDENYLSRHIIDSDISTKYEKLRAIDKNGMFTNILLNEYKKAGDSIFGENPDPCLIAESKQFLNFLYNIAIRDSEEETELKINSNYFNVSIILAANSKTLEHGGINPHIKRIKKDLTQGFDTVYIFGIGRKMGVAKSIARQINSDGNLVAYAIGNRYKHVFKDGIQRNAIIFEISRRF